MVVRLVALLLVLASTVCGINLPVRVGTPPALPPAGTPTPTPGELNPVSRPSYTVIERVEGLVLESYPMRVMLSVSGYQPRACNALIQVIQRRAGNDIYVRIYQDIPADVICPDTPVRYSDTILLDGSFENGSYTVHVNDYEVHLTL